MKVGVIGSGSIGPDLAYGFVSALAKAGGGTVFLHDIRQEALDAGVARIRGYVEKALSRGKISAKGAKAVEESLRPTLSIGDLSECGYVLEAATEDLATKKVILRNLEKVVRPGCLVGFATSGIPRARIASEALHPERCFVNHPFFPAWRSTPIEVVLSGHPEFEGKMLQTLRALGKVPLVTADVPCFAADDIFCNYCAEAARMAEEGTATPAQVDRVVDEAIGGGGPFNVMDLTRGNLLNVHCCELMREAPTGGAWFAPPAIFSKQADTPWIDKKNPGDASAPPELEREIRDRILAVLLGRTYFVVDNAICDPRDLNWLTRNALGFRSGLLDLAEELGAERVHEICDSYATKHPGFPVPASIREKRLVRFDRNLIVERDGDLAVVTIFRPEAMNALNRQTVLELKAAFARLDADERVKGIVLAGYGGPLAGADIHELAALKTPEAAEEKCLFTQDLGNQISSIKTPVVAAVDGPVLGGGAELTMACHARVVGKGLSLGQPEVNLGIIPGSGGTQRLPRLVGVEHALDLLRTGRTVGAAEAIAMGWASGESAEDPVAAAKALLGRHLDGEVTLAPVSPAPVAMPERLPHLDIGHRSRAIDAILADVLRTGLSKDLSEGLKVEARGFARCKGTVDYDIGMTNFIQNGPRVSAEFLHE